MQVEVKNGLAAVAVTVDHQTISFFRKAFLLSQPIGGGNQLSDKRKVILIYFGNTRNMFLGNQNGMNRGLGVNVFESEEFIVFEEDGAGDLFLNDFAKKTLHIFTVANDPVLYKTILFLYNKGNSDDHLQGVLRISGVPF